LCNFAAPCCSLAASVASSDVCVLAFCPHHLLVACCDTADDCVDPTIMILLRFRVVVPCVLNFGHSSQSLYLHSASCRVKYGPFSLGYPRNRKQQREDSRYKIFQCFIGHFFLLFFWSKQSKLIACNEATIMVDRA